MSNSKSSLPFYVPTKFTYKENGHIRNYELSWVQKIFVLFSYSQSSLCSYFLSNFEKSIIMLNLIVYVVSWQGVPLNTVHSCPNPVCSNEPLCPNKDICPPVISPALLGIQIFCTAYFAIHFIIQAVTSMWVPARLAEVLYPLPDALQASLEQSRDTSTSSLSINGKLKRRKSLIGDRITTTQEGKSNWNSIQQLQSTISIDPIYEWHITLSRYLLKTRSIIQIVTTIPMLLTFIFCYHNYQPDLWYINASRILQLAELFKLQSYQRAVKVISNTLLQTYKTFFFLYWFVMLLVVVFGAIMFALERGELTVNEDYPDGEYLRWNIERTEKEVSPFRSLAASMWYTLVSITTVGYGDIVPTTVAGRAVGSFLLLISFLIVALPITVIGEAFANAVDEYNNDKVRSRTVINTTTTSSSSNGNNTSFRPNFDRPTLHSLESMLRDSAGSIEENKNETDNNIATNATTSTSYNPIRRSLLRPLNRASTRAMNAILQEIQNQQQTEEQKIAELEQEKQQEIIDQWVDCLEKTTTSSNSSLRELLELQFELYQNNQKMKEIESEYLKQLKSFHEIQAVLFEKIQILMMTLNQKDQQSNQLKTNGEVSGGGARGGEGKEVEQVTNDKPVEVVSAKNEITTFEIQL